MGFLLLGFYGSQACYYSCNLLLESACRGLALQHVSDNDSLSHTHSARSDGGLALRARSARSRCLCLAHTYKLHVLQRLQSYPTSPRLVPHAHGAGASTTEAHYGLNYPLRVNLPGIGPSPSRRHKHIQQAEQASGHRASASASRTSALHTQHTTTNETRSCMRRLCGGPSIASLY